MAEATAFSFARKIVSAYGGLAGSVVDLLLAINLKSEKTGGSRI